MQLKRIQGSFERFKEYGQSAPASKIMYLWECQQLFQDQWDIDAPDFRSMYDSALNSTVSRRLWSRENYAPKQMILEFAALEPEMVRLAFRDLFDEGKDIEVRIDRFLYYCNDLLKTYKAKNQRPAFNRHFHDDDYAMISLYLAFRYPERYAPYDHKAFTAMLRELGASDIPQANDPARWFKVARTLYNMMLKDPDIPALHARRVEAGKHYAGDSLLLAYEFCLWSAGMETPG